MINLQVTLPKTEALDVLNAIFYGTQIKKPTINTAKATACFDWVGKFNGKHADISLYPQDKEDEWVCTGSTQKMFAKESDLALADLQNRTDSLFTFEIIIANVETDLMVFSAKVANELFDAVKFQPELFINWKPLKGSVLNNALRLFLVARSNVGLNSYISLMEDEGVISIFTAMGKGLYDGEMLFNGITLAAASHTFNWAKGDYQLSVKF